MYHLFFRWQVQNLTLFIYKLCKLQRLTDTTAFPIAHKGLDSLLMVTIQLSPIEFQSFFLSLLRRIAHIAFSRFLDAKDITLSASFDKDLLEWRTAYLVVKTVNREDLLAVDIRQGQCGLDVIELILELALVEQHEHVGVVDDGLL